MPVTNLNASPSVVSHLMAFLRDKEKQKERTLFRKKMRSLGQILGYEISKKLQFEKKAVHTPLATSNELVIKDIPVLVTILRAGLPLNEGLADIFEDAEQSFVSAYRHHLPSGGFEIRLEYVACPSLAGRVVIVSDPMLATARSMVSTLSELKKFGEPKEIHVASIIASTEGVEHLAKNFPEAHIWACAIDQGLNDHAYIVPGLGDAGDLAFGAKVQG